MEDPLDIGTPKQPRKKIRNSRSELPKTNLSPRTQESEPKILSRSRSFLNRFRRSKSNSPSTESESNLPQLDSNYSSNPSKSLKRKSRFGTLGKRFKKSQEGMTISPDSEPRSTIKKQATPQPEQESLPNNDYPEKLDFCDSLPIDMYPENNQVEIQAKHTSTETKIRIRDTPKTTTSLDSISSKKLSSKFHIPLEELTKPRHPKNAGQLSDRSSKLKHTSIRYIRKSFTHRDEQRNSTVNFSQTSRNPSKLTPIEITFQKAQQLYNEGKTVKSQKIFKEIFKEYNYLQKTGKITSKLYFLFACSRFYFAQCCWDCGNCKNSEKHTRECLQILDGFLLSEKAFLPKFNNPMEEFWTPGYLITLEIVWYHKSIAEELVCFFLFFFFFFLLIIYIFFLCSWLVLYVN